MAHGPEHRQAAEPALPDAVEVVRLAARAHERDRYLAALLSPRTVREDLIALAAFAGDVGRIPATVSQRMLGEIRLQWWRDAIEQGLAAAAPPTGHPIADALVSAVRRHGLDPSMLGGVIDAVADRLQDRPFADLAALDAHLLRFDGGLFRLAHSICGGREYDAGPLIELAGGVYGLARMMTEAPADLAQGRLLYPADMMAAHGCTFKNAREPAARSAWDGLSATMSAVVLGRYAAVAEGYQRASAELCAAILPVALVKPYLRASERADLAQFQAVDIGPMSRVWRLWLARRRGRI